MDSDLFVIDEVGNPYIDIKPPPAPSPPPIPVQSNIIRGDLKVAAKYQYRPNNNAIESGSESEDDEDFDKILKTNDAESEEANAQKPVKAQQKQSALVKDYYEYELPNLESLSLVNVHFEPFGKVVQHCEALVLIKAHPNTPFLDIDTMLFDSEKKPVGRIYELIGAVTDPLYNLLFQSAEEASSFPIGTEFFYAPVADEKITKILYLQDLKNNSKWHNDEGLGDSEDEPDIEESKYYEMLRRQVEEYDQRKRVRSLSLSSQNGPPQAKQQKL